MSLLAWKKSTKGKSNLSKNIKEVKNTIAETSILVKTNDASYQKLFKPVTDKFDDFIFTNLIPNDQKKKTKKKELAAIDYKPEVDPFEDMDVESLIDDLENYVPLS